MHARRGTPSSLDRLRTAVHTADLAAFEELLADDVVWYGSRAGTCRSSEEVIGVLRGSLADGVPPELVEARRAGTGVVLTVELQHPAGSDTWTVAFGFDRAGFVVRMQDYESAMTAQALRGRLLDAGVWPGEIVDGTPGPRRQMRVVDPDGYCVMIAQIDG